MERKNDVTKSLNPLTFIQEMILKKFSHDYGIDLLGTIDASDPL